VPVRLFPYIAIMHKSAVSRLAPLAKITSLCFLFLSFFCLGQIKAANVLGNPGFEAGDLSGWISVGPNNYILTGAPARTGNDYYKVYQTFNSQTNSNGIYQDCASGPGVTYSADGWAYTSSSDLLAGQNTVWIEVTFRDGSGNVLALYRSSLVTTNSIAAGKFPKNTWVDLAITNQYDPNSLVITNTAMTLTAPTGTCFVRYQVMFQGDKFNSSGSMYFDDLTLNQSGTAEYGPNWNIVWSDEFNGTNLNRTNWTYDIGNGFESGGNYVPGWGNNELEYYTTNYQNVHVTNGLLHINAQQQSYMGFNYTSARIKSINLFSKTYGRFEWRAKLPSGIGFWPALWMLPATNTPYGGWPNSGEIDVTENNGSTPNQEGGTIHYGGANGNDVYSGKTFTFITGDSVTNFHTYLLEWSTNSIKWYVDGHLYENQTGWYANVGTSSSTYPYPAPFNSPFYILMNLAIGGNYLGNPSQASINTNLPGELQVDYIRVYDQTPPLQISAAHTNGKVVLSWPTNIVCHLQAQTNSLTSPNWTDIPGSPNPFTVTPVPSNQPVFYRLESP